MQGGAEFVRNIGQEGRFCCIRKGKIETIDLAHDGIAEGFQVNHVVVHICQTSRIIAPYYQSGVPAFLSNIPQRQKDDVSGSREGFRKSVGCVNTSARVDYLVRVVSESFIS